MSSSYSVLDTDDESSRWLGVKRRLAWLIGIGMWALGYYWFGWWGVLLAVFSYVAGCAVCSAEIQELVWKERHRILPSKG